MIRRRFLPAASILLGLCLPAAAADRLRVVATTEDLASIAREVGGDQVEVEAIARGYQDPHFVEAKPSFILKLNKADLLVLVGKELELGWLPPLLQQSRNPRIQPGTDGYLDASEGCRILDIPVGQVSRAMGDVHPQGNPHYWLDPDNGRQIARHVAEHLARLRPAGADGFQARLAAFEKRLATALNGWSARMAPFKGTKVVTYHRSLSNFADRFGLDVVGYVEPRPGIPPSPAHTVELIAAMRRDQVRLILIEPYFDSKTPAAIARETGARLVVFPPSVGGVPEASDYFKLFDHGIQLLVEALGQPPAGK